jgi:SecD/SecF fusion protein
MKPAWTFTFGILLLILFGWYFATDIARRKRILGAVLTIFVVALCLEALHPLEKAIRLGLDLQGGTSFLMRLVPEKDETGQQREIAPNMLDQAVEVIRKRVDQFGVSEPVITPQGHDRIFVQIPGLDAEEIGEARSQLQRVARLEFKLVHPQSEALIPEIQAGRAIIPPGYRIQTAAEKDERGEAREQLLVKQRADFGGQHVSSANAFFETHYGVRFVLDSKGADLFGRLTAAHQGERLAIVLDGEVISAPQIKSAIYGGEGVITGRFDEQEARNLASVLENPLETPVVIEETRSVSATLGADSIKSGVYAGIVGLLLTFFCVLIYYKFAGLVANIALIINILVLFGAMSMFNFVLTLPGIAGIILTIGMAIDANVLIYERLREEMAAGKSLRAAIDAAYEKAFSAIFDSNVTTLITALILFWQASGPVRGFAVTLTIGIIASMFTALLVTRNCFSWAIELNLLKQIRMLHLIKAPNFDFIGKRRVAIVFSLLLIGGGIAFFAMRGEKNFGIDFKGGDLLVLEAKQKISEANVRAALGEIGLANSVVQIERSPGKEFLTIRSDFNTSERVEEHLKAKFPQAGLDVEQRDKVGKLIGAELTRNSLIALALGLVGILVYVTLRFEFSFALGALVALFHDIILTVTGFSVLGRELSLIIVGAVLTIAGYSINDTIVVFDRIREGLRSGRRGPIHVIMNQSINETLSRTVLTGGTTLLTVTALYLLGGPVLQDFALAIIIGLVVGTYSSIFVAAPIVLWWSHLKGKSLRREVRDSESAPVKA